MLLPDIVTNEESSGSFHHRSVSGVTVMVLSIEYESVLEPPWVIAVQPPAGTESSISPDTLIPTTAAVYCLPDPDKATAQPPEADPLNTMSALVKSDVGSSNTI